MCEVHKPHLYPSRPDKVFRICEKCFDSWACKDSCDDGNEKECFHPCPSEAMEVRKMDDKPLRFRDLKASDIVKVEPLPPPAGPTFLTHDEIEKEMTKMENETRIRPMPPYMEGGDAVRQKETGEVGIVQACFWRPPAVVPSNPEVTDIGMYVIRVWVPERHGEVLVLHRYEAAAEGWERIKEEEIVKLDFQVKPESCLDKKEK